MTLRLLNLLLFIVPLLMLLVVPIAPALGQDQDITDLLQEGYIYYTQGNYEDTLTAFETANKIDRAVLYLNGAKGDKVNLQEGMSRLSHWISI